MCILDFRMVNTIGCFQANCNVNCAFNGILRNKWIDEPIHEKI